MEADRELGGWLRLAGAPALRKILGRVTGVDRATGPTGRPEPTSSAVRRPATGSTASTLAGARRPRGHRNAVVVDLDRDGQAIVVAGRPDGGEDLTVVRARHVILASGLVERTLTFTGNDLPGVMLATAARRLAEPVGGAPRASGGGPHRQQPRGRRRGRSARGSGSTWPTWSTPARGGGIQRANGIVRAGRGGAGRRSSRRRPTAWWWRRAGRWTPPWPCGPAPSCATTPPSAARPSRVAPGVLGVVGALAGDADLDQVVGPRHRERSPRRRRRPAGLAPGAVRLGRSPRWPASGARRAAPPQPPLGGPTEELKLDSVSVGVVDFAEDVTAFELVGEDPVTTGRLLTAAAAAPAVGARARAELADLGRRLPGVGRPHPPAAHRPVRCRRALRRRSPARARWPGWPTVRVRRTALFDCHVAGRRPAGAGGRVVGRRRLRRPGGGTAGAGAGVRACGTRGGAALFDVQGDDAVRLVNLLVGAPANGVAPMGANGAPDTGGAAALTPVGGVLEGTDAARAARRRGPARGPALADPGGCRRRRPRSRGRC